MNDPLSFLKEKFLLTGGSSESRVVWISLLVFAGLAMLSTAVSQAAATTMIAAYLVHIARAKKMPIWPTNIAVPVLALMIARVLAIVTSVDMSMSLPSLWKEIPFYVVVLSVAQLWDTAREDRLILLLRVTFGAAVIVAVIGTLRFLLGFDHRASSITSGYYTYGMFLTVVLVITILFGRNRSVFPNRWVWAVGTGLIVAGILLSMNRIHWIAAGSILVIIGVWRERRLLTIAVAGCAVVIMLVPSLMERVQHLQFTRQNMSDRDILWRGAMELGREHPVTGWGLRTFQEIFPHRDELGDKRVGSWHNDLLQLYMESGLLGVLAYIWLLGAALVGGFKTWRRNEESETVRTFSLGVVLAMLAFVISGMTGVFLTDPIAGVMLRILLGFAAAYMTIKGSEKEKGQGMSV